MPHRWSGRRGCDPASGPGIKPGLCGAIRLDGAAGREGGQHHSGGRAGGEGSPQWGLVSPQLREEAWKGFATLDDPLTTLLDMLDASRGCGGPGPSLEAWVARELERWLQAQPCPGRAQVSPTLGPWPVPFSPCPALHPGPHAHLTWPRQPTGVTDGGWASNSHVPGSLGCLVCAPAHPQHPPTSLRLQVLAAPQQAYPGTMPPAHIRSQDPGHSCRLH